MRPGGSFYWNFLLAQVAGVAEPAAQVDQRLAAAGDVVAASARQKCDLPGRLQLVLTSERPAQLPLPSIKTQMRSGGSGTNFRAGPLGPYWRGGRASGQRSKQDIYPDSPPPGTPPALPVTPGGGCQGSCSRKSVRFASVS